MKEEQASPEGKDEGMQVVMPPKDDPNGKRIGILTGVGVALLLVLVGVLLLLTRQPSNDDDLAALLDDIPETAVEDEEVMEDGDEDAMAEEDADFVVVEVPLGSNQDLSNYIVEVEGYYTEVEMGTSLEEGGPTVTCAAFTVTDGPEELFDGYSADSGSKHRDLDFILGETGAQYGQTWIASPDVASSTAEEPIRAYFATNIAAPNELVGCADTVKLIGTVPDGSGPMFDEGV